MPPAFVCHLPYVTDGDTIRCRRGRVVRIARIDAPELPGHCRAGRRCAPGGPYKSKAALVTLIGGRDVQCVPVPASPRGGSVWDRYGRIVARCSVNGMDIGGYMLARGLAVRWPR